MKRYLIAVVNSELFVFDNVNNADKFAKELRKKRIVFGTLEIGFDEMEVRGG